MSSVSSSFADLSRHDLVLSCVMRTAGCSVSPALHAVKAATSVCSADKPAKQSVSHETSSSSGTVYLAFAKLFSLRLPLVYVV